VIAASELNAIRPATSQRGCWHAATATYRADCGLTNRAMTSALPLVCGSRYRSLVRHWQRKKGLTVLLTTHNMAFGYEADRVITLEDGKVIKDEDLGKNPLMPGLVGQTVA
jgi:hypothetical protein